MRSSNFRHSTPDIPSSSPAGTWFEYGCAASSYEQPSHPRLLIGRDDLATIRTLCEQGDAVRVLAALRERTDRLAELVLSLTPEALVKDKRLIEGAFGAEQLPGISDLAFMAALDDDVRKFEAVRHMLFAALESDRHPEKRSPRPRFAMSGGWYFAWAFDLLHDRFSHEDRRTLAAWLWRDGVEAFLQERGETYLYAAGSNVRFLHLVSAFFNLMAVAGEEGIGDIDEPRRRLLLLLQGAVQALLGPDGYPWEDMGYGTGVMALAAPLFDAIRRAGWWDVYAHSGPLLHFGQAILHFVQPWGEALSIVGDHGNAFADRQYVLARLAERTNDPTLIWLAGTLFYPMQRVGQWSELRELHPEMQLSDGRNLPISAMSLLVWPWLAQPVHPRETSTPSSFVDRGRGLVSLRSGWRDDDLFVYLDGSQRSGGMRGHEHDSAGHLSLSAAGEYFAIAMGRYSMHRQHHNVVTIEGVEDTSDGGAWRYRPYHGQLRRYETTRWCDWASVDASQQAQCVWSYRHVGMVRGEGDVPPYVWIVDDVNFDDGVREQNYQWRLHVAPGNTIDLDAQQATIRGWRQGGCLDAFFAMEPGVAAYGGGDPLTLSAELQRCGSPAYIKDKEWRQRMAEYEADPTNMVNGPVFQCPLLLATVKGIRLCMVSVLVPRSSEGPPPRFRSIAALPNTVAFELAWEDCRDQFIWAADHGLLEAADIRARGQWCWVRRKRSSGEVIGVEIADGDEKELQVIP